MTSGRCPTCEAELPADAPQGLCPTCLMQGVAARTEPGPVSGQRPAAPSIDAVRAAFPHLEILELIGQGGMGAVFKARQPKLNRFVALKILPESMARDPSFAERLAREGQLMARLNHPNVVTAAEIRTCVEIITNSSASLTSKPPDVPPAALPYPIPIARWLSTCLTIGLLALFVLTAPQLRQLPSYVLMQVSAVAQGDWLQGMAVAVAAAGIIWIIMFVWRRRAWFTVALLRMPVCHAGPASMAEPLLILAWKGVLALCAVSVLWGVFGQVVMMPQMVRLLPNLPYPPGLALLYFIDACLSPVLLSIALAVLLVRRELRRQDTFFTPASAPAWMPRVAFLFVLFAVVSSLPLAIIPFAEGTIMFTVYHSEIVVILALALLTRSRIWRAIALIALLVVLTSSTKVLIVSLLHTPWAHWPGEWTQALTPLEVARLHSPTMIIGIFCSSVGLLALLLPSSRAAFGLPPRRSRRARATVPLAHA